MPNILAVSQFNLLDYRNVYIDYNYRFYNCKLFIMVDLIAAFDWINMTIFER